MSKQKLARATKISDNTSPSKAKTGAKRGKTATATNVAPIEVTDRRRHDLLDAAFLLVAQKGVEGLRTRDIAAHAEVNISTLHYYFGTKETLVTAVIAHALDLFVAPQRGKPKTASLREHLDMAFQSFADTPNLATVLVELMVRAHREPGARAAFRDSHRYWNLEVERILRESIEGGTVRADIDPHLGAFVVTSTIIGAMIELNVNPKAFDFAKVARELVGWLAPTE